MSTIFKHLEQQARALRREEKAELAHILIEELDTSSDPDADRLWLEEAQRRYKAFQAGEMTALPGEEVMQRARTRLK